MSEKEKLDIQLPLKKRQVSDNDRDEKVVSNEIEKIRSEISIKETEITSINNKIIQIRLV